LQQLYNGSPIDNTVYEAIQDVQASMLSVMKQDTLLLSRGLTGIFDEAPAVQAYPYISFGTKTQLPYNVFRQVGFDCTVTLDIWTSQWSGDLHIFILNDVYRLFNNQPLPLKAWFSTWCYVEMTTTSISESMQVRHTLARVRTLDT
jgi:Protein of unknown function (DUF3168)